MSIILSMKEKIDNLIVQRRYNKNIFSNYTINIINDLLLKNGSAASPKNSNPFYN